MTGLGWQFFAAHTATGEIKDELTTGRERSVSWELDAQGEASVTLSAEGDNDQTHLIEELRTDLIVTWDGRGMWRGRFGGSLGSITETEHVETFGAVDYRGFLTSRRHALEPLSWAGTDHAEAAWNLVRYTQHDAPYPGGDLGIGRGDFVPIATSDVDVPNGQTVGGGIDDLAARWPGFDWWVDADKRLHAVPQRGTTRDFPLSLIRGGGGTCSKVDPVVDTTTYANLIHQTGADGLTPAVRFAPDLDDPQARPEGRLEAQEANPDITSQAGVNATAQTNLARRGTLAPGWTFTVKPGLWTPDLLWVGDFTPITVRSGRYDIDTVDRVTGITVKLTGQGGDAQGGGEDDEETGDPAGFEVEIRVSNRLAQDVHALLRTIPARLGQLARR